MRQRTTANMCEIEKCILYTNLQGCYAVVTMILCLPNTVSVGKGDTDKVTHQSGKSAKFVYKIEKL